MSKYHDTEVIMRSAAFSYGVSILFFLMSIGSFIKYIITGIYDMLELSIIILMPATLWTIWVASFKLVLNQDSLTYSHLVGKTRSIKFSDISKVDRRFTIDTQLSGPNRINIWNKKDHRNPFIVINIKMFRASDVKYLLSVLRPYSEKQF